MMGHREKLKGGDEWDALCRRSRRILLWKPGQVKAIKRIFNKRQRREAKLTARSSME